MASGDEIYRESQARLHRVLGAYLAILTCKKRLDCIVLERNNLLSFLKLERMKNERIDWLKTDLKYLFNYSNTTKYSKSGTYASLYLFRGSAPEKSIWKTMRTEERIIEFAKKGITAEVITIPSEKELLTDMALISNGIEEI